MRSIFPLRAPVFFIDVIPENRLVILLNTPWQRRRKSRADERTEDSFVVVTVFSFLLLLNERINNDDRLFENFGWGGILWCKLLGCCTTLDFPDPDSDDDGGTILWQFRRWKAEVVEVEGRYKTNEFVPMRKRRRSKKWWCSRSRIGRSRRLCWADHLLGQLFSSPLTNMMTLLGRVERKIISIYIFLIRCPRWGEEVERRRIFSQPPLLDTHTCIISPNRWDIGMCV